MGPRGESCGKCYFYTYDSTTAGGDSGWCHRYPPPPDTRAIGQPESLMQTLVIDSDWCGEFKPLVEPAAPSEA